MTLRRTVEKSWIRSLFRGFAMVVLSFAIAPWIMELWILLFPQSTNSYLQMAYIYGSSRWVMLFCMIFLYKRAQNHFQFAVRTLVLVNSLYAFMLLSDIHQRSSDDLPVSPGMAITAYSFYSMTIAFNSFFHIFGLTVFQDVDGYHMYFRFWRELTGFTLAATWLTCLWIVIRSTICIASSALSRSKWKHMSPSLAKDGWGITWLVVLTCYVSYQHAFFASPEYVRDYLQDMVIQILSSTLFSVPVVLLITVLINRK